MDHFLHYYSNLFFFLLLCASLGLLRLQELFQRIRPGSDTNSLLIEKVRRVENYKEAIDFLISLEMLDRFVVITYLTISKTKINQFSKFVVQDTGGSLLCWTAAPLWPLKSSSNTSKTFILEDAITTTF
jgi:hypothetical protein